MMIKKAEQKRYLRMKQANFSSIDLRLILISGRRMIVEEILRPRLSKSFTSRSIIFQMNNQANKSQSSKLTIKSRLRSASREGAPTLAQPRIAIQNPPYRNITAEKHRNHSIDNQKQVKKTKKKKVKQKEFKSEVEDAELRRRLEEEIKRRDDLEKYMLEQQEKMTQEERERLKNEESDRLAFEMEWDKQMNELRKKKQEQDEWDNYIQCNTNPDPRSERDLNTLVYQLLNQGEDGESLQLLNEKIKYIHQVANLIEKAKIEDQTLNNYQRSQHYSKFQDRLRSISNAKLLKIVQNFVAKYEQILDENNRLLKNNYYMPEFTKANLQRILQRIAQKQEERQKYEILKSAVPQDAYLASFWFNPLSKSYRIKPVEFEQIHKLQIELPRQLVGSALVLKVLWTKSNPYQDSRKYDQYQTVSGIFHPECLELPELPKKSMGWALVRQYDENHKLLRPCKFAQALSHSQFVSFTIPKEYFVQNADKLYLTTYQNGEWTTDGTEDLKINLETRQVSFQLKSPVPFTLSINRFVDFPFKDWRIGFAQQQRLLLHILTNRGIKVNIELFEDSVQLLDPKELLCTHPELGRRQGIIDLLISMRNLGLNLIAQEEDAICLKTPFKISDLENQVLLNLMQTVQSFVFRQAPQSRQCESGQIFVQFLENPVPQANLESIQEVDFKWKILDFQFNKVAVVDKNGQILKNTVSHVNLVKLFVEHNICPFEILGNIEEIQQLALMANMRAVLKSMRLLSMN